MSASISVIFHTPTTHHAGYDEPGTIPKWIRFPIFAAVSLSLWYAIWSAGAALLNLVS